MTVAKFRISSYFAQITSIVSCFRKYHSKVLKRFSFFEIEESPKALCRRRKWPKIVHYLFARTNERDDIFDIPWVAHSACLTSINLISKSSECYNILGRYKYLHRSS